MITTALNIIGNTHWRILPAKGAPHLPPNTDKLKAACVLGSVVLNPSLRVEGSCIGAQTISLPAPLIGYVS